MKGSKSRQKNALPRRAVRPKGFSASPRPDDSRSRLLQAAKKVFHEKGFDGATIKDLADEAGLNVSLVSYHFGGKEALYRECLTRFGQERFEFAERLLQPGSASPLTHEDFRIRLTLFLTEFIEAHLREPEVSRMLHREVVSGSHFMLEGMGKIFIQHFEAVVEFLSLAQKSGIIRKDLNPQFMAALLVSGLVHLVQMEPLAKKIYRESLLEGPRKAELARTAITLFLDGALDSDIKSQNSLPKVPKTVRKTRS